MQGTRQSLCVSGLYFCTTTQNEIELGTENWMTL